MNREEIKPIALAVIELCLSEGVDSQQKNLLNKKNFKFHSKLMQRFTVDLKTFLGLAMPNQCSMLSESKYLGGIFGQETPNLNDPYI